MPVSDSVPLISDSASTGNLLSLVLCLCFNGLLERVKGIEPSYAAWEAAVLPLNYTRELYLPKRAANLSLPWCDVTADLLR